MRLFTRDFYIGNDKTKASDKHSDAVIYFGDCSAIGFCGKRNRPDFNYSFKSNERRDEYINQYFKDRRATLASKETYKQEKKSKALTEANATKVGDIFYSSWGYDQTNVDFYKVIEKVGKLTFKIQEVYNRVVSSDAPTDYVVPAPDHTKGKVLTKRMNNYGFTINSFATATRWNGEPKYQTSLGWGH